MGKKRWYLDAALILVVLILGVLVVLQLTGNTLSPAEENQPAEMTPDAETAESDPVTPEDEAVNDPAAEPEVLTANEDQGEVDYAPEFTLSDLDGNPVSLADYSGTPLLVNFWATWCPPCRSELPLIQQYQDQFAGDFVVLAVDGAETAEDVRSFVESQGYNMVFLLDTDYAVAELYKVRGFPTSVFIDAEGAIQKVHIGELTEPMIIAYLDMIGISE